MNIYIDGEWNSYGGDLISMALISDDGSEFYEVLHCANPDPWVAENVMPKLNKAPVSMLTFVRMLETFLAQFDAIHIIADWPEDIAWFCRVLIVGPGMRLNFPKLTMEVVHIDAVSDYPHNALHDARALAKAHKKEA